MENNAIEYFLSLADYCDKNGYKKMADQFDFLIKDRSLIKVSQYVGIIGYSLKNQRSICNCQRRKRLTSDAPMQEIVLECLKEYQDGQKYYDEDWTGKYASLNIKQYVNAAIKTSVRSGIDIVTASEQLIDSIRKENNIDVEVEKINALWKSIKSAGLEKNAIFSDFENMVKIAVGQLGFWQGLKNIWRSPWAFGKDTRITGNLAEIQRNIQSLIKEVYQLRSDANFTKNMQALGVDLFKDWEGSVSKLNELKNNSPTIASTANKYKYVFAVGVPWSLPVGTKPEASGPAATTQNNMPAQQQVDPKIVDYVLGTSQKLYQYVQNISQLIAKLRTFPNITKNEATRNLANTIFGLFEQIKNPTDFTALNNLANKVGELQSQVSSPQQQQQKQPAGEQEQTGEVTPTGAEGKEKWDWEASKENATKTKPSNIYLEIPKFISGLDPKLKPAFINALKDESVNNIIETLKADPRFKEIVGTLDAMRNFIISSEGMPTAEGTPPVSPLTAPGA